MQEKTLEFSAEIKRKHFWSKREVKIKENCLTYNKKGSNKKRIYNIEKLKFSVSINYKKRGEFNFCFYEKVDQTLFYMKINKYSVFDKIVNFFKNKNLWPKDKNNIFDDINLKNLQIDENDISEELRSFSEIGLRRKNTTLEIVNNKKKDKKEIMQKINDFKTNSKKQKILFRAEKNESFFFIIQNKILRYFFKILFKSINYLKFLMNINSFKFISNSIMIAFFLQIFSTFNYKAFFFTLFIMCIILYWVLNFNFFVKKYLNSPLLRPEYVESYRSEAIEMIKDILFKNLDFFFKSKNFEDEFIEIKQNKNMKNEFSTIDIYFVKFKDDEVDSFVKVKSSFYSFSITFFGKFEIENYNKLNITVFKIENMLKVFSNTLSKKLEIKTENKNNSSKESKFIENQIFLHSRKFQSERKIIFPEKSLEINSGSLKNQKIESLDLNQKDLDSLDFSNPSKHLTTPEKIKLYTSQEYIDYIFKKKLSEYETEKQTVWETEKKTKTYEIQKKPDKKYVIRKCTLKINKNIKKIIKTLKNPSLVPKYNDLVSYLHIKKNLTPNCQLGHMTIKCPFPISDRDFLDFYIYKQISENRHIFMVTQAPDLLFGKVKKYTRGSNCYAVYDFLVGTEGVGLVLVMKSDSKLRFMPKSVVEMGAGRVGMIAVRFKEFLENGEVN